MLKTIEQSQSLKRIMWTILFYLIYKTSLDNLDKITELIKFIFT